MGLLRRSTRETSAWIAERRGEEYVEVEEAKEAAELEKEEEEIKKAEAAKTKEEKIAAIKRAIAWAQKEAGIEEDERKRTEKELVRIEKLKEYEISVGELKEAKISEWIEKLLKEQESLIQLETNANKTKEYYEYRAAKLEEEGYGRDKDALEKIIAIIRQMKALVARKRYVAKQIEALEKQETKLVAEKGKISRAAETNLSQIMKRLEGIRITAEKEEKRHPEIKKELREAESLTGKSIKELLAAVKNVELNPKRAAQELKAARELVEGVTKIRGLKGTLVAAEAKEEEKKLTNAQKLLNEILARFK